MKVVLLLLAVGLLIGCGEDKPTMPPTPTPDPTDTEPPNLAIEQPQNGATVPSQFYFTVNAWDNRGIHKIDLYVNNRLRYTAYSYSANYKVGATSQQYMGYFPCYLKAIAHDLSGNSRMTSITVQSHWTH